MHEYLWIIWQLSRTQYSLDEILDEHLNADCEQFFERIINENIPLAEMVDFIFVLEDIPISLREQLVRHRIGVKVAGQEFCDVVPDLADSSFWSQSMRVLDMGDFEEQGRFWVPESLKGDQVESYQNAMKQSAVAYTHLVAQGVPREDARNVIPLGATHRIVWKLNLAAIKHIISKRSCWILQLGLWKPIIQGIVEELCKLSSSFRQLATPPCMEGDNFKACLFCENNLARIRGDVDPLPPCALFLNYYKEDALACSQSVFPESETCWYTSQGEWTCCDESRISLMFTMFDEYSKFWNRNPVTGKRLL